MKRPDLPVLTTLRFPAAFAIFLYHFLSMTSCPLWIWEGLNMGVSFFYILSGFILYYNYSSLENRRSFWVARLARIWPIHLVTCLMALLLLPFPFLLGHASWPITLPANLLLVHAWLPFKGSALSFNGVSWSLSVEAFFYLSFPWLLTVLHKRGAGTLLPGAFAVGLILISLINFYSPARADLCVVFNPVGRLFEFVLGMCTCKFWLTGSRSTTQRGLWLGYEALVILLSAALVVGLPPLLQLWGMDNNAVDRWLITDIGALGFAGLIWVFAHQAGFISKTLSTPFLTRLGEISFSMYMCHQILLRWLVGDRTELSVADVCRIFPIYLLLSLVVAMALFFLVETPARHAIVSAYRRRFPSRS